MQQLSALSTSKTSKYLFKIIGIIFLLLLILTINFRICVRFDSNRLRLNFPIEEIISYDKGTAEEYALEIWQKIFKQNNIKLDTKNIPFKKHLHVDPAIPLKWNPYPPFIGEYNSEYPKPDYSSLIVLGNGGNKYQISLYFRGETDSTPSILTKKIKGASTNWGDYYTKYLFVHDTADVPRIQFYEASWEVNNSDASNISQIFLASLILLCFQILIVIAIILGKHHRSRIRNIHN